jgi:hypothetical protein
MSETFDMVFDSNIQLYSNDEMRDELKEVLRCIAVLNNCKPKIGKIQYEFCRFLTHNPPQGQG